MPPHRFHETREGRGTPIVLIHGLGGSADWWRHNIDVLAESHTVAAVDLVGFGSNRFFLKRSSLPLEFDDIAALLARWIESSFDEPVHLVGNSMGGQIAIHLAAARPDLVRSLILVNSTGIPFALQPRAHIESLAVPYGWMTFGRILARDLFRAGPTSMTLAFARLLLDDARPLLRALKMPVLLMWGETDPLVPVNYAERFRAEVPHAKLVRIPRAGHIPMWENPAAFNGELLEFVNAVDAQDGVVAAPAFTWGVAGYTNGVVHRAAGRRKDIVLVHGLGMSSRYFIHFARALYERGWNPVAPDLPGFGESENAPGASPQTHARTLARWAEENEIKDAVWLGHSTGCNAVAHLVRERPDLVRRAAFLGPLWTNVRFPQLRFALCLTIDAFREPLSLYRYIFPAYWRAGLWRWFTTWMRHREDLRGAPELPADAIVYTGRGDPIPDRNALKMIEVEGAHACHYSHPDQSAEVLSGGTMT